MSETCKETVGGPWHFKDCGRPAKGRGGVIGGKDVPLCGVHLAAIRKRAANDDARTAKNKEREAADKRAAALSAARDELVRAAVALAPDIAAEHPDASGYRVVNITERDAVAFCAAVAAYEKLAGGA